MKFNIMGSDVKMNHCRQRLESLGHVCCDFADSEIVILPLPTVKDGLIAGTDKPLSYVIESQGKNQRIFYGNLKSNPFRYRADSYYTDESFLLKNADLTAKGVLRVLYDNVFDDLDIIKAIVLGYGRCGKAICNELRNNGIDVTACTRRAEQRILANKNGIKAVDFSTELSCYDVIINTVEQNVISGTTLAKMNSNNLYIETASPPYGFDVSKKDRFSFRYILAGGLPGKYFPEQAGANIADTVLKMLENNNK